MKYFKISAYDLKIKNQSKIISALGLAYILGHILKKKKKKLLFALLVIPISGSFINFDAYFKALIHFHTLQLGKALFSQQLVQLFLWLCCWGFFYYSFYSSMLVRILKMLEIITINKDKNK